MKSGAFRIFTLMMLIFLLADVVCSEDNKKTPTPLPFPTLAKNTPTRTETPETDNSNSKGSEKETKRTPTPAATKQPTTTQGNAGSNSGGKQQENGSEKVGGNGSGKEGGNGSSKSYPPVALTTDYLRTIKRGSATVLCGVEKVNGSIKGNANDNASCNLSKAKWVPGDLVEDGKFWSHDSRVKTLQLQLMANGQWPMANGQLPVAR